MADQRALPHVVIVGGGFGGLEAARALKHAPVRITLIDRTNHHLFQPLLYQVATSVLGPSAIAAPIRHLLRAQKNVTVVMAEVSALDTARREIQCSERPLSYDYLVLATGARGSYFGHDEWAQFAPPLKSIAGALRMRDKILKSFELAEIEEDPSQHRDLLTFVLVGGGPTGVEMAGALASMTRATLRSEFRRIDPASARVILVDAGPRILATYAESLSRKTCDKLTSMGVEIRTGARVEHVDAEGVVVSGERIASRCVFWTAGVHGSPAATWLGAEADHAGRVKVLPDLTVPGHPEIFVVGDTAYIEEHGKPLPGVAQVAIQSGRYAGKAIHRRISAQPAQPPFKYFDKGNMATVSLWFAVMESGKVKLSGFPAKMVWAFLHVLYLSGFENRLMVLFSWLWAAITNQAGSRLIEDPEYEALRATDEPGGRAQQKKDVA
jgi:NADH dehydrogenase FAD-containing subunit